MNKFLTHITKKDNFKKNQNKVKLNRKQGVVLAETILIIAISLVIVVTIFYPTIKNIISDTFASISSWYTLALANLGI